MSNETKLSRREFIKDAAIGAAAVAGASVLGATPAQAQTPGPWLPAKWDQEADVVIVGYGGAGACAAISASTAGANVLVLEKAPQGQEGGNTRVSGNRWFHPSPADKAVTYLTACAAGYPIPQDMVKVWADEMGKNNAWLTPMGATPYLFTKDPEFPELPGADCSAKYVNSGVGTSGQELLWIFLKSVVDKKGIKVLYGTPATELVQDPATKEILGVIAESKGAKLAIKAKKAVILTCGGFENNQQMIRDFLSKPMMAPRGTPFNTGDGIIMAQKVGAVLWHMDAQSGMSMNFQYPGTSNGVSVTPSKSSWIHIDGTGNRYINENIRAQHGYSLLNGVWLPRPCPLPTYQIFDEVARAAGPLSVLEHQKSGGWAGQVLDMTWSKDNLAEVDKGWIIKGATIAELATKIKVDPKALEATITKYNGFCATGVDAEFGRPKANLVPIATPPFYAISLVPSMLNTQGGPKHNVAAQIVDANDKPIPRLYAAGECGSLYSYLYPGGGNVGECIAFGRIAGQNATALKPWDVKV